MTRWKTWDQQTWEKIQQHQIYGVSRSAHAAIKKYLRLGAWGLDSIHLFLTVLKAGSPWSSFCFQWGFPSWFADGHFSLCPYLVENGCSVSLPLLIKAPSHSSTLAWKIPWTEEPGRLQSMGSLQVGRDWATSLSLFTFHFHALEKEMATHSSVLAWRIPGMGEPGGLPSMGSHRVAHDRSDLAAAASVKWG